MNKNPMYAIFGISVLLILFSGVAYAADQTVTIQSGAGNSEDCALDNSCVVPFDVVINPGDTVTFEALDTPRPIYALVGGATGEPWDQETPQLFVKAGFPNTHTYNNVGTFQYHDINHPWIEGQVTVIEGDPDLITVPDVVGLSEADAEAAIIQAGFRVGLVDRVHRDTVPVGEVVHQIPRAGELTAPNSEITITLSLGPFVPPTTTTVPNVVHLPQAQAEIIMRLEGTPVGTVTNQKSDTVFLGNVISTNPPTDTEVPIDSPVNLVVSDGPLTEEGLLQQLQAKINELTARIIVLEDRHFFLNNQIPRGDMLQIEELHSENVVVVASSSSAVD